VRRSIALNGDAVSEDNRMQSRRRCFPPLADLRFPCTRNSVPLGLAPRSQAAACRLEAEEHH
jgi:hypothetical protein